MFTRKLPIPDMEDFDIRPGQQRVLNRVSGLSACINTMDIERKSEPVPTLGQDLLRQALMQ